MGDTIREGMHSAAREALAKLSWQGHQVLDEYLKLWEQKHNDYGPDNHAVWGCQGVVIRMCDKLIRLKGYYFEGLEMMTDSVEDSWLDIIGYALIGLVIERDLWPTKTLTDALVEMYEGRE